MAKKRGPIVIAENLDSWHVAYSVIILILFFGFLPAVQVALEYPDFVSAFQPFVSTYTSELSFWAVLFTVPSLFLTLWYRDNPLVQGRRIRIFVRVRSFVFLLFVLMLVLIVVYVPLRSIPSNYQAVVSAAGGYSILAFYALTAIIGPGFVIYILNPAAKTFFLKYPLGYQEKLRILERFREYDELSSSRFSFLLAEVYGGTSQVLSSGFPYLDAAGLDDTFVDIQIAMRMGTDSEKEAAREFFEGVGSIPYRIGTLGTTYSNEILMQVHRVRNRLIWSDNLRRRNGIKGAWGNGIIGLLKPYTEWILVVLTGLLVALTLILVLSK